MQVDGSGPLNSQRSGKGKSSPQQTFGNAGRVKPDGQIRRLRPYSNKSRCLSLLGRSEDSECRQKNFTVLTTYVHT